MPTRPEHLLTDRERRFVDEYLLDLNQAGAARRAGYSATCAKRQGCRLMRRPRVRAAVERAMAARALRIRVDQDGVVQALAAVAFGDMRSLFDDTGALLPFHRLPDEAAALVTGLDIVAGTKAGDKTGDKAGHGAANMGASYVARVRTADRLKALELLGRHLGMFSDKLGPADGDGPPPAITVTFVEGKSADQISNDP